MTPLLVPPELPAWWRQLWSSQRREIRWILAELLAMRGLMPLLMKVRNGSHWSEAEKIELLAHLRRFAHLSPYLLALLLPGSALLLPLYAWWLDRRRLPRDPVAAGRMPGDQPEGEAGSSAKAASDPGGRGAK